MWKTLYSDFRIYFVMKYSLLKPIPVDAQSKAWICGRTLVGIAGLNRAGGMDDCLV